MKLNNIELSFDNFASEMAKLKNEKHFDYLVPSSVKTSVRKVSDVSIFLKTLRLTNVALSRLSPRRWMVLM